MKAELPLDNTAWTVERPVALSVIKDLMEITQISDKTPISFYGYDGKSYQQGSTLGDNGVELNKWAYDERVYLEVDEDFDPDWALQTSVYKNEYQPVFVDELLGIVLRPVFRYTKVSLSFKYRALDRNQAQRWRNEMAIKCSQHREQIQHEVGFSYTLPAGFLYYIKKAHDLREAVAPYGESLNDYFTARLISRAGLVTDVAGKNGVWAVSETLSQVLGMFDFDSAPQKGQKEDDHDNWMTEVTYVFSYMKPIACTLEYPIMIHQQLVPAEFLPKPAVLDLEDKPVYYSHTGLAYRKFHSSNKLLEKIGMEGIRSPIYDDWRPRYIKPTTLNLMTTLVSVTEQDKRTLFNLKDLGDFQFTTEVLQFIQASEWPFVCKNYQSIIQIDLYEGTTLLPNTAITMDAQLNLVSTADLDLRKVYHVRISIVAVMRYLPKAAIVRLQNAPAAALKFVSAIQLASKGLNGTRSDIPPQGLNRHDQLLITGKTYDPQSSRGFDIAYMREFFVYVYGKNLAPAPV